MGTVGEVMTAKRTTHALVLLTAVAAVLLLAACGSSGSSSSGGQSASGGGSSGSNAVSIKNFAYDPPSLTVAKGSKVTFTNHDQTNHTATASGSGAFDTGTIAPGKSMTVALNSPGTFSYACNFHPFMHGTVKVTP